jgi:hypothetical protein
MILSIVVIVSFVSLSRNLCFLNIVNNTNNININNNAYQHETKKPKGPIQSPSFQHLP